jgi:hypothetical protein
MSFATHIHVTRIAAMRIIFTRIGCTLLTCDMYTPHHIAFIIIISLPPTPPCNKRHHTYGYVTCSKVNVARSSGTSSDVTITVRNIPQRKDIYMSTWIQVTIVCLLVIEVYVELRDMLRYLVCFCDMTGHVVW